MDFKIDFHVHTSKSFDSLANVKSIVRVAKSKGLDAICVTDHDVYTEFENLALPVFRGCEITTDVGDLLGVFIKSPVKSGKWQDVVLEVHKQGGLVILPHPYNHHTLSSELIRSVDAIEVYNSRVKPELNKKAFELAKKYDKPTVASSDAHFASDVGNSYTIVDAKSLKENDVKNALLKNKTKLHYRASNRNKIHINRAIKLVKLRQFNKILPFIKKKILN